MAEVREDLEAFTAELFDGFFRADQRRWGQVYVRGLLLDGRRKSVEPMAARLGEDGNRQALAHFVTTSPWNPAHVRARLAWKMQDAIGPEALIVDDTGFLNSTARCLRCREPIIKKWLLAHPRFHLHFTPTSSSWLNLVERWFAELTQKKLKRGVHRSVQALERDIRSWLADWNDNPRPFVWTKTADEILDKVAAYCRRISDSGH
jgi:hypothetical protein